jgi:hypothetical protein
MGRRRAGCAWPEFRRAAQSWRISGNTGINIRLGSLDADSERNRCGGAEAHVSCPKTLVVVRSSFALPRRACRRAVASGRHLRWPAVRCITG